MPTYPEDECRYPGSYENVGLHFEESGMSLRSARDGRYRSKPISQTITCFAGNGLPLDRKWLYVPVVTGTANRSGNTGSPPQAG
jgi:hypothetical protein